MYINIDFKLHLLKQKLKLFFQEKLSHFFGCKLIFFLLILSTLAPDVFNRVMHELPLPPCHKKCIWTKSRHKFKK